MNPLFGPGYRLPAHNSKIITTRIEIVGISPTGLIVSPQDPSVEVAFKLRCSYRKYGSRIGSSLMGKNIVTNGRRWWPINSWQTFVDSGVIQQHIATAESRSSPSSFQGPGFIELRQQIADLVE